MNKHSSVVDAAADQDAWHPARLIPTVGIGGQEDQERRTPCLSSGTPYCVNSERRSPRRSEREWMAQAWGRFNAGTILLRGSAEADEALSWWRDRCLEWCHRVPEAGRWADQRYLDEWPRRWPGVGVVSHPGAGLAPWNGYHHELSCTDGAVLVDGRPLVFYHHQGLRLHRGPATLRRLGLLSTRYRLLPGRPSLVWRLEGKHSITPAEERLVWAPYLRALQRATAELRRVDPAVPKGFSESLEVAALRRLVRSLARRSRRNARRSARRVRKTLRRRSKRARRAFRNAVAGS